MVLERYSDDIIREVTSPITGIQRRAKFPPSIAEIVEICDDTHERTIRFRNYAQLGRTTFRRGKRPFDNGQGAWAQLFVPASADRYAEMLENTKKADKREWRYDHDRGGIWVVYDWWEKLPSRRVAVTDLEQLYETRSAHTAQ